MDTINHIKEADNEKHLMNDVIRQGNEAYLVEVKQELSNKHLKNMELINAGSYVVNALTVKSEVPEHNEYNLFHSNILIKEEVDICSEGDEPAVDESELMAIDPLLQNNIKADNSSENEATVITNTFSRARKGNGMAGTQKVASLVWYHFVKCEKGGRCRYCHATLTASGSTFNLHRHLKNKHPTVLINRQDRCRESRVKSRSPIRDTCGGQTAYMEFQGTGRTWLHTATTSSLSGVESLGTAPSTYVLALPIHPPLNLSQPSINDFVDVVRPLSIRESREIDMQLLKMICTEYQPFSFVENQEFKKLLHMLSPNYKLPGRKTLSNSLLPAVYNEIVNKLLLILEEAPAICLTCDGWTNINKVSFYAVTAHFFDKNTNLKNTLLDCSEFNVQHTSKNISIWLDEILKKYKIRNKICAIVTDNAANMKTAIKNLDIRHISCFAHSLNQAVQTAISNSIKATVDKVKSVVQFFKQSSQATAKLTELQQSMNNTVLKLKQDVPTRWNSTYDMLERFFRNKNSIISVLALLNSKITFSESDWDIMNQSINILKLFHEVTEEISASKSVSISKTCILAKGLMKRVAIDLANKDLLQEVKSLCTILLDELTKRFGGRECQELIGQSIFLDPRFKKQGFGLESHFQEISKNIKLKIRDSVSSVISEVVREPESSAQLEPSSSIWEEFDADVSELVAVEDLTSSAIIEVDKYLVEPLLNRNVDPFVWWEERKSIFPNVYQLALKRLCIPATSVPCERIFSKAGQLCTEKRSRLTTSKLSKMLFINSNSYLL